MISRYGSALALLIVILAFAGCAADLEPAPAAKQVPGIEDAARSTVEGVTILTQPGQWPGPADIDEEVVPLRVRIENQSGNPLRVRYNEFQLIAPDGRSFAALPLARMEGEVAARTGPYRTPGFYYEEFQVAPYNSSLYPGIGSYRGTFTTDPDFYRIYQDYWDSVELPTRAMYERVIPEGVINSGGTLEGWLFFENVTKDFQKLDFRADLVNAESGRKFGEIRIPFQVD